VVATAALTVSVASVAGIVLAYFVGTFPTARLIAGNAIEQGSGNPGASNAFRVAGARAGIAVFAGDLAKGILATAAGHAAGGRHLAFACGAAAVVGHCFPVTRRFKGGKGVATAAGMALVLFPAPALVAAAAWGAIAKVTGKASIASVVAIVLIPAGAAVEHRPGWELAALAAVAALVVARHAPNLRRLARGEERSLR
jgi:glycerol-3-phosphate acyltransferase PlsY